MKITRRQITKLVHEAFSDAGDEAQKGEISQTNPGKLDYSNEAEDKNTFGGKLTFLEDDGDVDPELTLMSEPTSGGGVVANAPWLDALLEDSKDEETHNYGEDEGRDKWRLDHERMSSSHRAHLKDDMAFDQDRELNEQDDDLMSTYIDTYAVADVLRPGVEETINSIVDQFKLNSDSFPEDSKVKELADKAVEDILSGFGTTGTDNIPLVLVDSTKKLIQDISDLIPKPEEVEGGAVPAGELQQEERIRTLNILKGMI